MTQRNTSGDGQLITSTTAAHAHDAGSRPPWLRSLRLPGSILGVSALLCAALIGARGLRAAEAAREAGKPGSGASPAAGRAAAPAVAAPAAGMTKPLQARALRDDHARRVALGRAIFFDATLSEPAGTSCASCHDPAHAYAGDHGSRLGTPLGSRPNHFARRNTPSLLYLKFARPFHFKWEEDAEQPEAVGGFFWDGRSDSIAALVRQPLLNPDEMGNTDAARVASKLRASSYAGEFAREFYVAQGDADAALSALGSALEAFLTSDAMAPFSSKYDAYVRGEAQLSEIEARGLQLFRDGSKGGCDACHKFNDRNANPARSLFTDYGFEALAVPRNRKLRQNRDARHYDLGLCEPDTRRFPMDRTLWCGTFRTPSLRNVAVRPHYMHNGAFDDLREVVKFYATRGTAPRHWYERGVPFDDVPARYRDQISVDRVPYDRHAGQVARLSDGEIDAIVAFLRTLTDAPYASVAPATASDVRGPN